MKPTLPRLGEFVALMALLSSLTALAIDTMLPALNQIGSALQVKHENDAQLIVSFLFGGLAIGQFVAGPLADALGRKPVMYLGLAFFMVGSLTSMLASDFNHMLIGRLMQGIGASAPRIVTIALVRDTYSGRSMARIMSFIMGMIIFVPILAPLLGQSILWYASWRAIFSVFLVLAVVALFWFIVRIPETLTMECRRPLTLANLKSGIVFTLSQRSTLLFIIAVGMIFGAFMGYLNSSQQILQYQYQLGEDFPYYFALLAVGIGVASLINARSVMRLGMHRIIRYASTGLSVVSMVFIAVVWQTHGHPPLVGLLTYLLLVFFSLGLLFGNLNALAMEPLGAIAGIGASIVGSLSTLIAILMGTFIGQQYNHTVMPLTLGFWAAGLSVNALMYYATPKPAPVTPS